MTKIQQELVAAAKDAQELSKAKYSNFRVGAALRTESGKVFTGCNIESSSYGLTVCAERVALFKALSEGEETFTHLAVVTDVNPPSSPCGACRQLLWDYARNIEIILAGKDSTTEITTLKSLLPRPFGDEEL